MPTAKLKCATKLINQRKLLGALFRDVSEKLEVGLEPELNRIESNSIESNVNVLIPNSVHNSMQLDSDSRQLDVQLSVFDHALVEPLPFSAQVQLHCSVRQQAWVIQNKDLVAKAQELIDKGVTEDRVFTEQDVPEQHCIT